MKVKVKCDYCGKEFEGEHYYYDNIVCDAYNCAIKDLNLREQFEENLIKAINVLDKETNSKTTINYCSCYSEFENEYNSNIIYRFLLKNDIFSLDADSCFRIIVSVNDINEIPSIERIINTIKILYNMKISFEGKLVYNGFATDNIGDIKLHKILKECNGKKVRFEVIE